MGENTFDVYAQVKQHDQGIELVVAVDLGGAFLSSGQHNEKAKIIKDSMAETKLPERTKCYLCDGMCPYASRCFSEEEFDLGR